jgi:hypothetical protein
MYDMYPWDARTAADAGQAGRTSATRARATHAVQVALDRRDNGGDTAAATPDADAAGAPAEPTAGPTRQ